MNNYLIINLFFVICFPSLFSYSVPFFMLGFFWRLLSSPGSIVKAFDAKIGVGFFILILLGIFLVVFNVIKFGDVSPWTYWIAGFFAWFVIIILIRSIPDYGYVIHQSFLYSSLFVGVTCLIYIALFFFEILKEPISVAGYQAYFGIDDRGFFAYSTSHVPNIPYLVAYLCSYRLFQGDKMGACEKLALFLMVIAGLLSLRSFIFIAFFVVLVYYIHRQKKWLVFSFISFSVMSIAIFSYFNSVDFRTVVDGIYGLKWQDKVSGDDIRYQQFVYWLESFSDAPIFGHGLSSVNLELYDIATGELLSLRPGPVEAPYGYEIYFAKLLSDMGLVFIPYVFIFALLSFFMKADKKNKSQLEALRFSAIVMIMQSMTNSYLQTSGWLFIFMLPMVFISNKKVVLKND